MEFLSEFRSILLRFFGNKNFGSNWHHWSGRNPIKKSPFYLSIKERGKYSNVDLFHFSILILKNKITHSIIVFQVAKVSVLTVLIMHIIFNIHIQHNFISSWIRWGQDIYNTSVDRIITTIIIINIKLGNIPKKSRGITQ